MGALPSSTEAVWLVLLKRAASEFSAAAVVIDAAGLEPLAYQG